MTDETRTVTPDTAPSRRWVSLAAICSAAGLVWLAFADLGVAIPTIADDFGADLSALSWANNAFSLVTGALVIAAGKFGDVVGGALGVAVLTAFARGFTVAGSREAIDAAGLTPDDVDQAHRALVDSSSFADALASLPTDLAEHVTAAAVDAFSTGVGRTMIVTAVLTLAITGMVGFLWPRRPGTDGGPDSP
ncbi:hypothetical protein [Rhodococcus sp. NPDC004095]